jgi:hypothetical protein
MNLDERKAGLIRLIEGYRETECRALLDAARAEARGLRARAFREERARLHQRVTAVRTDLRMRIQAARAERDTRERAGSERANARVLALAWPRLRDSLAARWADPAGRRHWVDTALAQARLVLPAGVWTLRHAPGWTEPEWSPLAAELAGALGAEPRFVAEGSLAGGLTIETSGAMLDASLEGLLRDRTRIEGRLLALLAAGAERASAQQETDR